MRMFALAQGSNLMAVKKANSPITMQVIADHCGVSKMTVSHALHGDLKQVSQETVDRIQSAARELGYKPGTNHAARRLALRKGSQPILNHAIGLLISEQFYQTNYYRTLFRGVLEVLALNHYGLLLGYMYQGVRAEDLPYAFRRDELDAILTCHTEPELQPLLRELQMQQGFGKPPIVSMISRVTGCSAVIADHQMAGYLLVRHLLFQGHRHILHFTPNDTPPFHPFNLRLIGYRQAYYEMHLDPDLYLHYTYFPYGTKHLLKNDLYNHAENIQCVLKENPEITAILTPYDEYADVLIDTLSKHGKHVPEDISVMGLDNTDPVLNQHGENILTTVQMPLLEIGCQAARLALRHILHEETENVTMLLPVKLIERASTCPPKSLNKKGG